MKKTLLLILSIFLFGSGFLLVDESRTATDISWYSMTEAQELADSTDKKVMVYIEASWCTYCKRMESEVFPQEEVQNIMHEYYYPVRVDVDSDAEIRFNGEKMTQRQFAGTIRISGTPTFLFVGGSGKILGAQPGFIPSDVFKALLTFVGTDAHSKMEFEEYMKSDNKN